MKRIDQLEALIQVIGNTQPEEILLDSYQMRELLNCSDSTLRRLRANGTIPCNKIGNKYYYPKNFFTQEFLNTIIKLDDPSKRFDDK
ncbi:helix-turn-helix domain-containing protein [Flavobacterium wongokense]|uniref:helix-turn-helix domain-containing protein n=1 Tax=Flavobacterium wongokense TaxID=2910674 RepID=UPI001F375774|nr:helix-turn-helix domain-containing protein [Flavobacterium sp. WG47]MCF6132503.1 helix-turn-helix domain-containing protein [Flavobacterium sp. WG47]